MHNTSTHNPGNAHHSGGFNTANTSSANAAAQNSGFNQSGLQGYAQSISAPANYADSQGSAYGGYGYPPGTMTYTTGTYAGVNVMYTSSGPVGYSGNVAIMYSTPQPPPSQGGLVSPGGSMRDRRLPLLLSKQPEGEESTYVTVKAKK